MTNLSTALGSNAVIESAPAPEASGDQPTLTESVTEDDGGVASLESGPEKDVNEVILETILQRDEGSGVDYDTLVHACVMAGHQRETAEDAIDHLRDVDGAIIEPRFSFFQLLPE